MLQNEIDEFMSALWFEARMMTALRKENIHPRNSQSCFDYNRQCDFFDLCCKTSDIDDPRWVRKENIHQELEGETTSEFKKIEKLDFIAAT